jgi:hypothetical protein
MIALLALAGSGCGDSNDKEPQKAATAEKGEAAEEGTGNVPSSLNEVESGAEDTIDFARQGSRSKVSAAVRGLRRAEGQAAADLREAGVTNERISALKDRIRLLQSVARRASFVRVSLAANQISALMPEFFTRYDDPVPPSVLELDYLDREAQLRSGAGDTTSVSSAVRELSSTWTSLRPRVIEAGGRRIATRFTRHVASMRRQARDPGSRALQKEAAVGLELVDELERQFRK